MRTDRFKVRVRNVLNRLNTPSDQMTEFYDMANIADNALFEVSKLQKEMQEIIDLSKVKGYAGKMRMKHVAEMALRRAE